MAMQDGPTTPLPDKKLLLLILDKLQKKDTRGVFAEPVDAEELPDYHEVIKNPMDFDTVRKKLDRAVYLNLEQFEADIYLICSNAMQYNAPHTIYFRQARSIQELAKKELDVFRQGGGHADTQPKIVRRGRPPKKTIESSPVDRVGPKSSLDATLATVGDDSGRSSTYNLRKGPSLHRYRPPDGFKKASCGPRSSNNDCQFQASKVMSSKPGKKQFVLDEGKRDTYHNLFLLASGHDPFGLSIAEGQKRQLTPVGLHVDHSYARSLARFAANLGPVVWKIASRKMGAVLPPGVEFGPEWAEETESLPLQQPILSEKLVSPENSMFVSCDSNFPHLSTLGSAACTSAIDKSFFYSSNEEPLVARGSNMESGFSSFEGIAGQGLGPEAEFGRIASCQNKQPIFLPGMNGIGGQYGFQFASQDQGMLGNTNLVGSPLLSQMNGMLSGGSVKDNPSEASHFGATASLSRKNSSQPELAASSVNGISEPGIHEKPSWPELSMYGRWNLSSDIPPDLNLGFQASSLPNSSVHIGSPPQLDLMLQL